MWVDRDTDRVFRLALLAPCAGMAMSDDWSPRTRMVHAGARRSQYGET